MAYTSYCDIVFIAGLRTVTIMAYVLQTCPCSLVEIVSNCTELTDRSMICDYKNNLFNVDTHNHILAQCDILTSMVYWL